MRHPDMRERLYEFATGQLNDDERARVDTHLASCTSCTKELKEIHRAVMLLPRPTLSPGDERNEPFWARLTTNVEREIARKHRRGPKLMGRIFDSARSFFALRPGYTYAIGCSLVALIVTVFIVRFQPAGKTEIAERRPTPENADIVAASDVPQDRISRYFRKSRTLLVGIANLQTGDAANIDLRAEKDNARQLIHEARFVRMEPLNNRTERLVNDLERILIELANVEETDDLPNVELIRSGIRQQNLLFKIRMAEASFDTSRNVSTPRIY